MSGARIVMVIAALVVSAAWVAGAAASQRLVVPARRCCGRAEPDQERRRGCGARGDRMRASSHASMPGWTRTPGFTAVKYAAGGGFPDATIGGPIGGKANFFAGGPNVATSSATQVVKVTRFKAPIDAGQRVATLTAYLGGYAGHGDSMSVTATFLERGGEEARRSQDRPRDRGRTESGHRAD